MKSKSNRQSNSRQMFSNAGFTLIELMIGILISALAIAAMYVLYEGLQSSSHSQVRVAVMQQNLRGALTILEREIRASGMDLTRTQAGNVGFTDIRRYSVTEPTVAAVPDPAGFPALSIVMDLNEDGDLTAAETSTYLLYDKDNRGQRDLARGSDLLGGRALLAESIDAVGFAYAFDNDNDGRIDRAGGDIIWATDSNNDGRLDTTLDATGDGIVDINDLRGTVSMDTNGDGTVDQRDLGAGLGYTVQPDRIRTVKIWILARSGRSEGVRFLNTATYVVGDRIVGPMNDNFKRRILTETVNSRNL